VVGAPGFWPGRSRLSRRVSSLLAFADGRTPPAPVNGPPFVAAAALAAALALLAGGAITQRSGAALAVMWGPAVSSSPRVWTPEPDPRRISRETRDGRALVTNRPKRKLDQPLPPQALAASLRAAPAVEAGDLGSWVHALSQVARRGASLNLSGRSGYRARPLFDGSIGFVDVYRVERVALSPGDSPR
jgi:hypothetical protein